MMGNSKKATIIFPGSLIVSSRKDLSKIKDSPEKMVGSLAGYGFEIFSEMSLVKIVTWKYNEAQ